MKVIIHGHEVSYEESVSAGMRYLSRELNSEEQKVFFDQAYSKGHATFEDHSGHIFKLLHHGGAYEIVHG